MFQVEGTNSARGRPKITLVVVKNDMPIKEVTKSMTSDNRDMDMGMGTGMATHAIYEKLYDTGITPTPKKCLCFLGLILYNLLTKNSRSIYQPIMV